MIVQHQLVHKIKRLNKAVLQPFRSTGINKNPRTSNKVVNLPAPQATLRWLRSNELATGGIRVHHKDQVAYPEVSGYLVPTLLQYGERALAQRLVRWLLCIQRGDGSYTSPDGIPHIFDSGQVLRGLLAIAELEPKALETANRVADYLCTQMIDGGSGGFGNRYDGKIPESVHLYVLPPLIQAAQIFDNQTYQIAAEQCLNYYLGQSDTINLKHLTHFLAYELEALLDLGQSDQAIPILDQLRQQQLNNGAVRGMAGVEWVCTPGLAQLAICWYKCGDWESADRAMQWLEQYQQSSGGFLGSYGEGATYFPREELSWAAKFYLDAHHLRVRSYMERQAHLFPNELGRKDGRLKTILSVIQPNDKIIEVGCGKGRFLKTIQQVYPNVHCTGVDIARTLLEYAPATVEKIIGALENVPCPDEHYDVAFSVEAIEHSANIQAAVAELARIVRPGGWIVIVDKQQAAWGRLQCPSWESWPESGEITRLLYQACDNVTCEPVAYDAHETDGLMMVWRGQKRSRLTGQQWNSVLMAANEQQKLIDRIRHNQLSPWAQEILMWTFQDETVLEIGSGTGEISLTLALAGRRVSILDISQESLDFAAACAESLGTVLNAVWGDATQTLPFPENNFDCVWSSGLLEHFTVEERHFMLREWCRIAQNRVIALVPNGAAIAYRAGKQLLERNGEWIYGLEKPILSLRDEFIHAGLKVIAEYSVGTAQALNFLPIHHPLRIQLHDWMKTMSLEQLQECNQGYLLITIGEKQQRS